MKTTRKAQCKLPIVTHDEDAIHDEDGHRFIVHIEGKGSYDPFAPMCQDDYEYFSGTGQYAESEGDREVSV